MNFWLMKSEPETFSIDDLARDKITPWEGVRNYQARNFMMHEMRVGDLAFFYHSNAEPSGVVGLMRIVGAAHPDESSFDKKSEYFDEKSTRKNPRWFCVDCEFLERFEKIISLEELRQEKSLKDMMVLKRGMRLSVQPVRPDEFKKVCKIAKSKLGL